MASAKIDLQPAVLDLFLYAGDGAVIKFTCKDSDADDADTVDVSGDIAAQIRNTAISDDSIVSFVADTTDAADGIIIISLTGDDTRALSADASSVRGKFKGVWDVQWTPPGSQPRTLLQGKVECVSDVTR